MLTLLHLARQAGGGLHLAGVQGRPRQILTMTRLLDTVFGRRLTRPRIPKAPARNGRGGIT